MHFWSIQSIYHKQNAVFDNPCDCIRKEGDIMVGSSSAFSGTYLQSMRWYLLSLVGWLLGLLTLIWPQLCNPPTSPLQWMWRSQCMYLYYVYVHVQVPSHVLHLLEIVFHWTWISLIVYSAWTVGSRDLSVIFTPQCWKYSCQAFFF